MNGRYIEVLRKNRNISREELGKLTGYKDGKNIAAIEKGKRTIPDEKLLVFAKALNVPITLMVEMKIEEYKLKLEEKIYETIVRSNG